MTPLVHSVVSSASPLLRQAQEHVRNQQWQEAWETLQVLTALGQHEAWVQPWRLR
jgi:hypothetical protein